MAVVRTWLKLSACRPARTCSAGIKRSRSTFAEPSAWAFITESCTWLPVRADSRALATPPFSDARPEPMEKAANWARAAMAVRVMVTLGRPISRAAK